MTVLTKTCTECKTPKPLDEFWNHPTAQFGKRPKCIPCTREENGAIHLRRLKIEPNYNRDRVKRWAATGSNKRRRNLVSRYGLTIEQYDSLLAEQNGKCAICKLIMEKGKRSVVDHCHKTLKVRGIVHAKCNTAIALLNDSPEMCRMAAVYLER